MIRSHIAGVAISAAVLLNACASTLVESRAMRSYQVGQTLSAPVGGTLLVSQTGSVSKVRRWVGVLNSPDGWRVDEVTSPDYLRKELLYSGVSGGSIEIGYREFRGGLAAPAFFQNVRYDLNVSRTITFQNFQLEVVSATNERMTARLIRD